MTDRIGGWMQTYTGRQFWPLDPRPDDIDPADLAHALGRICRYGGHVDTYYSVAEHCVLLSHVLQATHGPRAALQALLHDAAEAYLGDMVRPLKRSMPDFEAAEVRVLAAVCIRFGLDTVLPDEVVAADNRILIDERAALLKPPPASWGPVEELQPLGVTVSGWAPPYATATWAARLHDLQLAVNPQPPAFSARHADMDRYDPSPYGIDRRTR